MANRPPPPPYDRNTEIAVWNRYSQTWTVKPKVQRKPPPPIRKDAIKEYHEPTRRSLPLKSEEQLMGSIQRVHGEELEKKGLIASTEGETQTGIRTIKKDGKQTTIRTYASGLVEIQSPTTTQYLQGKPGIQPGDVEIPGSGITSYDTQRYIQKKRAKVFKGSLLDVLESGRLGRQQPSHISMETFFKSGLGISKLTEGLSDYQWLKGKKTIQFQKTTTEGAVNFPKYDFYKDYISPIVNKGHETISKTLDKPGVKRVTGIMGRAVDKGLSLYHSINRPMKKVSEKLIPADWEKVMYGWGDYLGGKYDKLTQPKRRRAKYEEFLKIKPFSDPRLEFYRQATKHLSASQQKGERIMWPLGRATLTAPFDFAGAYGKEIREQPTRAAFVTGLFFVIPPILKGAGKVTAPIGAAFPKTTAILSKTVSVALPTAYLGTVGYRMAKSDKPFRTLGKIGASEITPMLVGGAAAARFWPAAGARIRIMKERSQFRSLEKLVRKDVIIGDVNFPTAQPKVQYKLFIGQKKYILPIEKGTTVKAMYHATPDKFPKFSLAQPGSSEIPGLYGSTELSAYFLKLQGGSLNIYGGQILNPYGAATAVRQEVIGFAKLPKIKTSKTDFMLTQAKKGYAYVAPAGKTEIEAVLTPGSLSDLWDVPFYTRVPSSKAAKTYQFMTRRGYQDAFTRIKPFSIWKPKTYWDRIYHQAIKGKKPGQFKQFGIHKGRIVPIERRITDSIKLGTISPKMPKKGRKISESYLYGSRSLTTPGSYLASLGLSKSYTPRSVKTSSYKSSKKTYRESSITRRLSKTTSRPPSRRYKYESYRMPSVSKVSRSYKRLSSRPYSSRSKAKSRSSLSLRRSSYLSRLSRLSSGSSYSSSTTRPPPSEPPPPIRWSGFNQRPTKKRKKRRRVVPKAVYNPSLLAVDKWIKGAKPKLLTGIKIRPLHRITYKKNRKRRR